MLSDMTLGIGRETVYSQYLHVHAQQKNVVFRRMLLHEQTSIAESLNYCEENHNALVRNGEIYENHYKLRHGPDIHFV